MEIKTPQEATRKVLELKSLKKEIDTNIKELETYLMEQMTSLGVNSFPFDFAKATIVQNEKLQIVNEDKVIEKLKELGLDHEYVKPRLNDLFQVKKFVEEHGKFDGIVSSMSEPYLKVTPTKE